MTKQVDTALVMMRMALHFLDRVGETLAACRLQQAIDMVGKG